MDAPINCQWCGWPSPGFISARDHRKRCPRLLALGFDLEGQVRMGTMTIERAEAEQAKRPALKL